MDRELAKAKFRAVAGRHVPSNVRRYSFLMVDAAPPVNAMLGVKVDYRPIEGKIVEEFEEAVVVKTGRADFALVSREILPVAPQVGCKVRITPYARRLFDGTRLDSPKVEESTTSDGVKMQVRTIRLGDGTTPLPIAPPQSSYLRDLVAQIERLQAPDGFRSVAQLLVDANATAFSVVDPVDDADIMRTKPELSFSVATRRFNGRVSVVYWAVPDYYHLHFAAESGAVEEVEDVDFTSLGAVLEQRIDDGEWRMARVEVERRSKTKGEQHG